ncbi:MAG TPA: cell division protein FtsZ, partial [Sphingomonas sp.]|nr:cell division protein FtsZ [Sphingomonas sp.]
IEELQKFVDTLIVIPNQNLFLIANANTTFKEAFQMADEVLQQGVRGITDLMVMPGLINLDFADVRSVMQEMGKAMMGTGEADGDSRAIEAAQKAIANPLLDGVSMQGAKGVIVSITGGEDMRLLEVDEAANHIRELVDPDANIIWGSAFNPELEGKIRVSVVATGIDANASAQAAPLEPTRAFSFAAPRKPAVAPAPVPAPAPEPEPVAEAPAEPVSEDAAPVEESKLEDVVAEAEAATSEPVAEEDELVLGADTMVPEKDSASAPAPKVFGDDLPPPPASNTARRRWLSAGSSSEEPVEAPKEAPAAPRVKLGGTLFERMSNVTRGATRDETDGDDRDPLDIPRFLHRQNNQ